MGLPNNKNSNHNDLSSKRRSLLKGSASSIPLILTLRSGAAFATQSAHCLTESSPDDPQPLVEAEDTWFRIPTIGRVIKPKGGGNNITIFLNPDPAIFVNSLDANDERGQWYSAESNSISGAVYKQKFKNGAPLKDAKDRYIMDQNGNKFKVIGPDYNCFVTAALTDNGEFTSPFKSGTLEPGDFLASGSCMTSLMP